VGISALMILRSPRRFAFAKLLVMTWKFKFFQQSQFLTINITNKKRASDFVARFFYEL